MSVTFLFGAQNFLRCFVSRAVPAESIATSRVAARTVTTKLERNISSFGNPRLLYVRMRSNRYNRVDVGRLSESVDSG